MHRRFSASIAWESVLAVDAARAVDARCRGKIDAAADAGPRTRSDRHTGITRNAPFQSAALAGQFQRRGEVLTSSIHRAGQK